MSDPSTRKTTRTPLALLVIVGVLALIVPFMFSATPASAGELTRFGSCAELRDFGNRALDQQQHQITDLMSGEFGITNDVAPTAGGDAAGEARSAAPDSNTGQTNTQVAGVDELDAVDVASDGRVLMTLNPDYGPTYDHRQPGASTLVLVQPNGERSSVELRGVGPQVSWDIDGDVAWVVSSPQGVNRQTVRVTRVSTASGTLVEDGTWEVSGWVNTGRRIGDRFILIANDSIYERNQLVFESDGATAVPCEEIWHPTGPQYGTTGTLVAVFDAGSATLTPTKATQIFGASEIVYASHDAVYATTTEYPSYDPRTRRHTRGEERTSIHRFDLDSLTFTGSGTVPGSPLNQFALDEHENHLRVATTVSGQRGLFGAGDGPKNMVSVLDIDGELDLVGQVGGLGEPGETIRSVRFNGDTGYVVTFEQTDPLYTLDLSDPERPVVTGELKIPGFSAYLHPIRDGFVVGIGPVGDEKGLTGGVGVQLFDVRDPAKPKLIDSEYLGDASDAQWDHHAFGVFGNGRFSVPVQDYPDYPYVINDDVAGATICEPVAPDVPLSTGDDSVATDDAAVSSPVPLPTEPCGPRQPTVPYQPRDIDVAVRVFDTNRGQFDKVMDLNFTVPENQGLSYIRTAVINGGDVLVITSDGQVRRFAGARLVHTFNAR